MEEKGQFLPLLNPVMSSGTRLLHTIGGAHHKFPENCIAPRPPPTLSLPPPKHVCRFLLHCEKFVELWTRIAHFGEHTGAGCSSVDKHRDTEVMESVKRKLQGLIEQRDEAEDRAAKIQSDLLAERKLREEVRGFILLCSSGTVFFPYFTSTTAKN